MSVGSTQKQQHSISFSFQCLHTHILCTLSNISRSLCWSVCCVLFSFCRTWRVKWGTVHMGPRGWGLNFKKILFCFLCHHKNNKYGCLFSSRYQHYTNYCPVSTPAYINCVVVMRVLVDHHCLRAWEALVESDLGCRKSFQLTSVRGKEVTHYSLSWWWH